MRLPGLFHAIAVTGEDWIDGGERGVDDADFDLEGCEDGAGGEVVGEICLAEDDDGDEAGDVDQADTGLHISVSGTVVGLFAPSPVRTLLQRQRCK